MVRNVPFVLGVRLHHSSESLWTSVARIDVVMWRIGMGVRTHPNEPHCADQNVWLPF